jgi:hypothetical protein
MFERCGLFRITDILVRITNIFFQGLTLSSLIVAGMGIPTSPAKTITHMKLSTLVVYKLKQLLIMNLLTIKSFLKVKSSQFQFSARQVKL